MNDGISNHSHFEELCAIAAIGQISPAEFEELSNHMCACSACQESYAEFRDLAQVEVPLAAAENLRAPKPSILEMAKKNGYKTRFMAAARARGMEFSGDRQRRETLWGRVPVLSVLRPSYQLVSAFVIMALLGTVGLLLGSSKEAKGRSESLAIEVSRLQAESDRLHGQMEELAHNKQNLGSDLARTETSTADLATRLQRAEEKLVADEATLQTLRTQLDASRTHDSQAEEKLVGAQRKLADVTQELASLRESRTNDNDADAAQIVQIADLARRNQEQQDVIEKQQKLLSVDSDVRNLMAARSLHITDVFDVDGNGKKNRAFGRVFYTEGKSLIFYAFDLDGPKLEDGKHSFQAWGQLASSTNSAVNLGIFYVDDPAQKRWMLKFDNPEVLHLLSAVFVTAEPHGGRERPTGQKLMYAYLGHDPNHP